MLVRRLLVRLPDRPGSLGRVTTLLGRLGIDIREVHILGRDGAHATDEFVVAVPGPVLENCLIDLVEEVEGVHVLAFGPPQAAQPKNSLVEYLVPFAEGEPDQPSPLIDVVVEDLGGHRHDAAPSGQ
jgi:hypothetical protein